MSNPSKKGQILRKIRIIKIRIKDLDGWYPETYSFLMQELDFQTKLLEEIVLQEEFSEID